MPPTIIDISHHNGPIDFLKVKASGVTDIFIKCTNGAFNTDDRYYRNSRSARLAGIRVGSYHFVLSTQSPEVQADNFLSHRNPDEELRPVIDLEWDYKNNIDRWGKVLVNSRIAMIATIIDKLFSATGKFPIIYTNAGWWKNLIATYAEYKNIKFGNCPLWLADYRKAADSSLKLFPWNDWTLRQYSDKGKIDGIKGDVDLNRLNPKLNGDMSSLLM